MIEQNKRVLFFVYIVSRSYINALQSFSNHLEFSSNFAAISILYCSYRIQGCLVVGLLLLSIDPEVFILMYDQNSLVTYTR